VLLFALGSLENMSNTSYAADCAALRAKLQTLIPPNKQIQAEGLHRIVRTAIPKRDAQNPHLETLLEAARNRTWLAIGYHGPAGKTRHSIQPARMYSSGGFWYVEAYSLEREASRNFRVDRVESAEKIDPPQGVDLVSRELPYNHPSHPHVTVELTQ